MYTRDLWGRLVHVHGWNYNAGYATGSLVRVEDFMGIVNHMC